MKQTGPDIGAVGPSVFDLSSPNEGPRWTKRAGVMVVMRPRVLMLFKTKPVVFPLN